MVQTLIPNRFRFKMNIRSNISHYQKILKEYGYPNNSEFDEDFAFTESWYQLDAKKKNHKVHEEFTKNTKLPL